MIGLTKLPLGASSKNDPSGRGNTQSRNRDKAVTSSTADLKASLAATPSVVVNAQGQQVPLNNNLQSKVTFDADFESANLDQVRMKNATTFDCWMRNDSNGVGNLQWFYFRMKNTSDFLETIRINIVNFSKGNSLFNNVSSASGN